MSKCSSCGAVNLPENQFCDQCGSALPIDTHPYAMRSTASSPSVHNPPTASNTATLEIRIGRDPANHVRISLDNSQVSSFHARVLIAPTGLQIEDLGSTNGTYVNGVRTQSAVPFKIHDEIRFGSFIWRTADLAPYLETGQAPLHDSEQQRLPHQTPPSPVPPEAPKPIVVQSKAEPAQSPPTDQRPTEPPVVAKTRDVVRSPSTENDWVCPSCGSDRICKVGAAETKKSGGGMGCITCLLLIIIFLIAGGAILLVVGVALVAIVALVHEYWYVFLAVSIVVIALKIIVAVHRSRLYYCERCGARFTRKP